MDSIEITENITFDEICSLECEMDEHDNFYREVKLMWLAMNDWPTGIEDTQELLMLLEIEIKGELNNENLKKHRDSLVRNLGASGNAWKAESLTSLEELFSSYPQINTLNRIFPLFIKKAKIRIQYLPREEPE